MDKIPQKFIKAGLVYLGLSTVLGILIAIGPGYSFMHSHFGMVGFLSFVVFGICYQVIPGYSGTRIFSEKLAVLQFWLANIGLVGLSLAYPFMRMYMLKGYDFSDALTMVLLFGIIEGISVFMFIFNIWKTMGKNKTD
jgi:cytochrome c oxidase cbb3-type subunit 1